MDNKLLDLADKKIEQMEHFNDITSKIIYEDIDGVGELIENRQEIITALDGISAEIRQYVSDQSIERFSPRISIFLPMSLSSFRAR